MASDHTHHSRGREAQYQGSDLTGAKEKSCRADSLVGRRHSTLHYTRPISVRIVEAVVDCNVSWSEANAQELAAYDDLVEVRAGFPKEDEIVDFIDRGPTYIRRTARHKDLLYIGRLE